MTGQRVERRLAAVLAAVVAGYSRLMGSDEEGTLARLKALRKAIVDPTIASHRGRIVKTTGDGMLVEFASAVDAVRSAVEIQNSMNVQNATVPQHQRIAFRIGIHVGDIIIDDNDIFGDGVNIAARLEGIAEPGGVCISDDTYRQIRDRVDAAFDDKGEIVLKNIARPVRVFALAGAKQPTIKMIEPAFPFSLPDKPSIAVLPFQNMSGDPEQEYFADGMVEDIITALSRFKSLFVIARNSSFTYKGKAVDIKQVGRDLGVRYVLEGSVRKSGNRVRITGQLIEASSGAHIWAGRFDREMVDIFALQDEVTQSVVSAIEPNLRSAEIAKKNTIPTENLDAYDLYLRALAKLDAFTKVDLEEGEALLRKAIAKDAHYSDAWAALADTLARQVVAGWRRSAADEAREAALNAVTLDPDNGAALALAAFVLAVMGGSLDGAVEFAERALIVHPNSAYVRTFCGWPFVYNGDFENALECLRVGRRMNPFDPRFHMTLNGMAGAYFFQKKFEEAISSTRSVLARLPHPVSFKYLAASLVYLDRITEARDAVRQLLAFDPSVTISNSRMFFRHRWMIDHLTDGLRTAGLPE